MLNNLTYHYLGLIIVVGLLVDEAVEDRHISLKSGFKARNLLILVWLLSGFLVTSGYKSVLLSTLVSIEYERPIDTIQDMLLTEKAIIVENSTKSLYMSNDPRDSIKELDAKITLYSITNGVVPDSVKNSIFDNEAVLVATDHAAFVWGSKIYQGKELLYSRGSAFMVPKSSPLKACMFLLIFTAGCAQGRE